VSDALPSRLKTLRAQRGWSLKQLAERAGVSAGMLSEVERGAKNPTVRLAYEVAQALGCSISELVEESAPSAAAAAHSPAAVVRAAPTSLLEAEGTGVKRAGYSNPLLHGRLEVVEYTLQPGANSGQMAPNRPGTMEFVLVLEGELELLLDGQVQRLKGGASAAHGVHQTEYRNASTVNSCRYLVLVETTRL